MPSTKFCSPIKVFHITNTLQIGGAETSICLLVKNLDRHRFSPTVICTRGGGPLEEDLAKADIPVIILHRSLHSILYFPLFLQDVLGTLRDLYRLFKKEGPVIVQTHLPASEYLALIAGKWAGVPCLIYTFLTSNFLPEREGKSLRTWLRIRLTRFLCGIPQVIVANSQAVREKLIDLFPQFSLSTRVIQQGIDLSLFEGIPQPGSIKKKIGLQPSGLLITVVGRLSPVKNQAMLLKAYQGVSKRHPDSGLVVVGEGPMRDHLLTLRTELGLEDKVHLLGRMPNVAEVLAETDIFVSTSRWEGLPLAILEAMAASVPVVATAVPGIQELLEKEGGVLVPLDDVEELEKVLDRFIEDPHLRERVGQKGREWVFNFYSLQTYLQRWQALYEELIQRSEAKGGSSQW
jgi:L-malate glycosyltransferase